MSSEKQVTMTYVVQGSGFEAALFHNQLQSISIPGTQIKYKVIQISGADESAIGQRILVSCTGDESFLTSVSTKDAIARCVDNNVTSPVADTVSSYIENVQDACIGEDLSSSIPSVTALSELEDTCEGTILGYMAGTTADTCAAINSIDSGSCVALQATEGELNGQLAGELQAGADELIAGVSKVQVDLSSNPGKVNITVDGERWLESDFVRFSGNNLRVDSSSCELPGGSGSVDVCELPAEILPIGVPPSCTRELQTMQISYTPDTGNIPSDINTIFDNGVQVTVDQFNNRMIVNHPEDISPVDFLLDPGNQKELGLTKGAEGLGIVSESSTCLVSGGLKSVELVSDGNVLASGDLRRSSTVLVGQAASDEIAMQADKAADFLQTKPSPLPSASPTGSSSASASASSTQSSSATASQPPSPPPSASPSGSASGSASASSTQSSSATASQPPSSLPSASPSGSSSASASASSTQSSSATASQPPSQPVQPPSPPPSASPSGSTSPVVDDSGSGIDSSGSGDGSQDGPGSGIDSSGSGDGSQDGPGSGIDSSGSGSGGEVAVPSPDPVPEVNGPSTGKVIVDQLQSTALVSVVNNIVSGAIDLATAIKMINTLANDHKEIFALQDGEEESHAIDRVAAFIDPRVHKSALQARLGKDALQVGAGVVLSKLAAGGISRAGVGLATSAAIDAATAVSDWCESKSLLRTPGIILGTAAQAANAPRTICSRAAAWCEDKPLFQTTGKILRGASYIMPAGMVATFGSFEEGTKVGQKILAGVTDSVTRGAVGTLTAASVEAALRRHISGKLERNVEDKDSQKVEKRGFAQEFGHVAIDGIGRAAGSLRVALRYLRGTDGEEMPAVERKTGLLIDAARQRTQWKSDGAVRVVVHRKFKARAIAPTAAPTAVPEAIIHDTDVAASTTTRRRTPPRVGVEGGLEGLSPGAVVDAFVGHGDTDDSPDAVMEAAQRAGYPPRTSPSPSEGRHGSSGATAAAASSTDAEVADIKQYQDDLGRPATPGDDVLSVGPADEVGDAERSPLRVPKTGPSGTAVKQAREARDDMKQRDASAAEREAKRRNYRLFKREGNPPRPTGRSLPDSRLGGEGSESNLGDFFAVSPGTPVNLAALPGAACSPETTRSGMTIGQASATSGQGDDPEFRGFGFGPGSGSDVTYSSAKQAINDAAKPAPASEHASRFGGGRGRLKSDAPPRVPSGTYTAAEERSRAGEGGRSGGRG